MEIMEHPAVDVDGGFHAVMSSSWYIVCNGRLCRDITIMWPRLDCLGCVVQLVTCDNHGGGLHINRRLELP